MALLRGRTSGHQGGIVSEVHALLSEITLASGGVLTPSEVVSKAEDPDSPLHDLFEWDDAKAGHQYRLAQARKLIARVTYKVTRNNITVVVPQYLRDPKAAHREQGYRRTATIATDKDLARRALDEELTRLRGAFDRAHRIAVGLQMEEHFASFDRKFTKWLESVA